MQIMHLYIKAKVKKIIKSYSPVRNISQAVYERHISDASNEVNLSPVSH
jgi:hypothetical protein